jgi:hypothetical protein
MKATGRLRQSRGIVVLDASYDDSSPPLEYAHCWHLVALPVEAVFRRLEPLEPRKKPVASAR